MRHLIRGPRALLLAALICIVGVASLAAPASAQTGQRTLVNQTGVQARDKYFELNLNQPANYQSPVNYVGGHVYVKLQVLDKPSTKDVIGQLCFWRHGARKWQSETCSSASRLHFTREGTFYYDLGTLGSFWKKGGSFNWTRPVSVGRFMLKDPITNKLLLTKSCGNVCYTRPDIGQHVPVRMHLEVILVPQGKKLAAPAGWQAGCPRVWSTSCRG